MRAVGHELTATVGRRRRRPTAASAGTRRRWLVAFVAATVLRALTGSPAALWAQPSAAAAPADGEIRQRETVTLAPEVAGGLTAYLPDLAEVLAAVTIERIRYGSDGLLVAGYLVTPRAAGPHPCVIFNRGGNRDFGALDDETAAVLMAPLARQGYVVVGSQYRGNGGGEGREEFGGRDVDDVLALVPLLERLPAADASRIGMYGWSRGGLMTYQALARSTRIKAAIIGAGPTDLEAWAHERPDVEQGVLAELVLGWTTDRAAAALARSPLRWPEKLPATAPILILHGGADWRVPPSHALHMAEALLAARRPFRLVLFEGGDHGLREHRAERDRLAYAWLDAYVRDGATWPSLEPHGD